MTAPGLRTPPDGYLIGVDVGVPQGARLDWDWLRDAGCSFAILRVAWGVGKLDTTFARNLAECERVGIPWGVYQGHTADLGGQPTPFADGVNEARYLLAILGGDVPPIGAWVDWETGGGSPVGHYQALEAWCETIAAAGVRPGIYTGPAFVAQMDRLDGPGMRPELCALAPRPIWLAHYTGDFRKRPRVVAPWSGEPYLWQASGNHFTRNAAGDQVLCSPNYSTARTLDGADVEVDANLFHGTIAEMLGVEQRGDADLVTNAGGPAQRTM